MPERLTPAGFPRIQPEQFTAGELDLTARADAGRDEVVEIDSLVVREPPVCGEWSYDSAEDVESRAAAALGALADVPPATAVPLPAGSVPSNVPNTVPGQKKPPAHSVRVIRTPLYSRALTPPTPLPALAELHSIHDAYPGSAKTAIDLAHALDKRGNIEGALSALQRAIDAGADGVELRCARAKLLSGRLRYDDAEAELKRAAKLKPDDIEVLLQQGILACRRAKWRDAVEPLEKVSRLNPHSALAHFYRGEALNKIDRLDDALAAYQLAAELDPRNYRALKGVGIVFDRMGRPLDAATFYRRARDAQTL